MTLPELETTEYLVPNGEGWLLHLHRVALPGAGGRDAVRGTRPVLIVHGYSMNKFIFGFHPRGTSLERCLAEAGFEVWAVDLRSAGRSRPDGRRPAPPSIEALAGVDVTISVEAVLARTRTGADRVDVLGASLGGSLIYSHLAMNPRHRIGSVVALGSPLRWVETHPLVRAVGLLEPVAPFLRVRGTRKLARAAMPVLARLPQVLKPYMNPDNVDLRRAFDLTKTIEDPHPALNRDLARWVHAIDLTVGGVHVTRGLARIEQPLLVVVAGGDGIVPVSTAVAAADAWGGTDVTVLPVGDEQTWYAHADLFVGDRAPETVFRPIANWLRTRHAS